MADMLLFALQRDLDMTNEDVQTLKKSYGLLDYIAKVAYDCQLEQLAQAAQMRRMEARLNVIETRLDKIEKTLLLIVKHLGIKTE
jgi:hypothetical protein